MSKKLSLSNRRSLRHSFGMLSDTVKMPNLIEIQKHSYKMFLDSLTGSNKKNDMGIHDALSSIFPVKDYAGRMSLKYISYKLDKPKYDVIECRQRGLTYSAALKVVFRLDIVNIDEDTKKLCIEIINSTGASSIKDMGKIMGELKKNNADSIDFSKAGAIIKELLNQK